MTSSSSSYFPLALAKQPWQCIPSHLAVWENKRATLPGAPREEKSNSFIPGSPREPLLLSLALISLCASPWTLIGLHWSRPTPRAGGCVSLTETLREWEKDCFLKGGLGSYPRREGYKISNKQLSTTRTMRGESIEGSTEEEVVGVPEETAQRSDAFVCV